MEKFLSSIYVDDVSFGSSDVESTYVLYLNSRSLLAEAGFRLRKFVTNSEELRHQVSANEESSDEQEVLSHASTRRMTSNMQRVHWGTQCRPVGSSF